MWYAFLIIQCYLSHLCTCRKTAKFSILTLQRRANYCNTNSSSHADQFGFVTVRAEWLNTLVSRHMWHMFVLLGKYFLVQVIFYWHALNDLAILAITTRRYAKRGICHRCVSVHLSITLCYCIKMAKRRITQITPHDSPTRLIFWYQRSWQNSNGIAP